MRPLPFTAQPILLTLRIAPEPALLAFFVFAVSSLTTHPMNVTVVVADLVIGAPAIIYPLWLWSRKLTVTPESVTYSPWFWRTIRIPYTEVRMIAIDSKRMMAAGSFYMYYFLRITGANGHVIKVTMDNYQEADLRTVLQEIAAHAEHTHLKGLAKGLLDGSYSFAKVRVS